MGSLCGDSSGSSVNVEGEWGLWRGKGEGKGGEGRR